MAVGPHHAIPALPEVGYASLAPGHMNFPQQDLVAEEYAGGSMYGGNMTGSPSTYHGSGWAPNSLPSISPRRLAPLPRIGTVIPPSLETVHQQPLRPRQHHSQHHHHHNHHHQHQAPTTQDALGLFDRLHLSHETDGSDDSSSDASYYAPPRAQSRRPASQSSDSSSYHNNDNMYRRTKSLHHSHQHHPRPRQPAANNADHTPQSSSPLAQSPPSRYKPTTSPSPSPARDGEAKTGSPSRDRRPRSENTREQEGIPTNPHRHRSSSSTSRRSVANIPPPNASLPQQNLDIPAVGNHTRQLSGGHDQHRYSSMNQVRSPNMHRHHAGSVSHAGELITPYAHSTYPQPRSPNLQPHSPHFQPSSHYHQQSPHVQPSSPHYAGSHHTAYHHHHHHPHHHEYQNQQFLSTSPSIAAQTQTFLEPPPIPVQTRRRAVSLQSQRQQPELQLYNPPPTAATRSQFPIRPETVYDDGASVAGPAMTFMDGSVDGRTSQYGLPQYHHVPKPDPRR